MSKMGYWNEQEYVKQLAAMLAKGQLVAGASDTVPGLLASVTQEGREQLDAVKKRANKPYLILVNSIKQAATLCPSIEDSKYRTLLEKYWPGPLTIILPAHEQLPSYVQSKNAGIAIRIPAHQGLQELLAATGPLFSTSANLSGEPVPERVEDISSEIQNQVAALVYDSQPTAKPPSTIIDCTGDICLLVREGSYSLANLKESAAELF